MKIQRKILFSLGIVLSLVLVVSAWGFSPTSADPTVSIPNGIQQYTDLCKALKNIEGEKLSPANCQLWATQSDQDKAVKNICDKYDAGSDHKLKGQCDAYSAAIASSAALASQPVTTTPHACGGGTAAVPVSIDIGCKGVGNPITDALFAIIRILSDGVGLVIIASIVVGGIQYTASRGDPQATATAIGRIRSTMIALLIYIFGYAILNYIIPTGFLH